MKPQGYLRARRARKYGRVGLLTAMVVVGLCVIGANASTALALSPAVETLAASSIGEKGATLNGKVNPGGAETKAYFEYGTTTSYGSKTAEVNVGSGTTTLEHSQGISGLSANTTYHYRIAATNSAGSAQGVDKTFTTIGPPAVSTIGVGTESSGEAATLKATVDPNGQSTTYQFEYGTESGKYPNVVPIPAASAGSGFEPSAVEYKITGLTKGTYYYWRVSASNASGKTESEERVFLSSFHPGLQISPASAISRTAATLNATVSSVVSSPKYWFEYGPTTSYGKKTATKEAVEGKNVPVSEAISGLSPNTVYHFRVVAENAFGTHVGPDQVFTTLTAVTLYQEGGSQLFKGSPLKALSAPLSFTGGYGAGTRYCEEAKENPGAVQSVNTLNFHSEEWNCILGSGYSTKYSTPSAITIEYAKNEAGEGVALTNKFVLVQSVYSGAVEVSKCEANLTLSGTFKPKAALEVSLSGQTEVIKGGLYCPGPETVSGNFVVTNSGVAVEAK